MELLHLVPCWASGSDQGQRKWCWVSYRPLPTECSCNRSSDARRLADAIRSRSGQLDDAPHNAIQFPDDAFGADSGDV